MRKRYKRSKWGWECIIIGREQSDLHTLRETRIDEQLDNKREIADMAPTM